jgi:hypothetical protein
MRYCNIDLWYGVVHHLYVNVTISLIVSIRTKSLCDDVDNSDVNDVERLFPPWRCHWGSCLSTIASEWKPLVRLVGLGSRGALAPVPSWWHCLGSFGSFSVLVVVVLRVWQRCNIRSGRLNYREHAWNLFFLDGHVFGCKCSSRVSVEVPVPSNKAMEVALWSGSSLLEVDEGLLFRLCGVFLLAIMMASALTIVYLFGARAFWLPVACAPIIWNLFFEIFDFFLKIA